MKKKLISLLVVVFLMTSLHFAVGAVDALDTAEKFGSANHPATTSVGTCVAENDKYVFIASTVDYYADGFPAYNGAVLVYKKPAEGNMGYKYITTIKKDSSSNSYDLAVKDMWVYNDTLYVTYNNATWSNTTSIYRGSDSSMCPLYSYDVSDVESSVTGKMITGEANSGEGVYLAAFRPYNIGGISFLDNENDRLYQSVYSGSQSNNNITSLSMSYFVFDVSNVTDGKPAKIKTMKAATLDLDTMETGSLDSVQIFVKDGYLYEVLQNNHGYVGGTLAGTSGTTQTKNSIKIYDVEEALASSEDTVDLSSYLVGTYETAIVGERIINDVEVQDSIMYVATSNGLKIVDISNPATPVETDSVLSGAVKAVELIGTRLFVGTTAGMFIYNIDDMSAPFMNFEHAGGFVDFKLNKDENVLYAMEAGKKGNVLAINTDILFSAVTVSDITVSDNNYTATVTNSNAEGITFKAVFALFEGNELVDIETGSYTAASGDEIEISASFSDSLKNSHVKLMLMKEGEGFNLIPMISGSSFVYKKETGTVPVSDAASEDVLSVAVMDINGNFDAAGTISGYNSMPLLVLVKNQDVSDSDRLDGLRYIDVITTGTDGKYGFIVRPFDSGDYEITVLKPINNGSASDTFIVPDAEITVQDGLEIPGVDAFVYVNLSNGQNIDTMELEINFDPATFSVESTDNIEISDTLTVDSVSVEGGKVTIGLAANNALNAENCEFCALPVRINQSATTGDYEISATVSAFNKFGDKISVEGISGTMQLVASTPKYDAMNAAIDALKLIKKAQEITTDDYLTELPKVNDAREKVDNAVNSYSVRESQLGIALVNNLEAAEEKMTEIKPYYDAVTTLNAAPAETIANTLKDNKVYFSITEDAIGIYNGLSDKTKIDEVLTDTEFIKPSDVYKEFHKILVVKAFKETRWQNAGNLLTLAKESVSLNISEYEALTDNQQAKVQKKLAYTEYEGLENLQEALNTAVRDAKTSTPLKDNSTGSAGGSYKVVEKIEEVKEPVATPVYKERFNDIAEYAWAKEAIEYLADKSVIAGRGESVFAPSDNVTREEFAKIIALAFDIEGSSGKTFEDVKEGTWYSEYISALSSAGIINGRDDGSFGVGTYISREDMAVILERTLKFKGIDISYKEETADSTDIDDVSKYALEAINAMKSAGIISGYPDGSIRPKENASRAVTAVLVHRVLMLSK